MAIEWTYTPDSSYTLKVKRGKSRNAITEFEDGTESRRLKSVVLPIEWTERYSTDAATLKAMLDFYYLRLDAISFVKASYDARDNPNEETTEVTVRFVGEPTYGRVSDNRYHFTMKLKRVF